MTPNTPSSEATREAVRQAYFEALEAWRERNPLRVIRQQRMGMTQKEGAAALETSIPTLKRWEDGGRKLPHDDSLAAVARKIGVDPETFIQQYKEWWDERPIYEQFVNRD